MSEKRDLSRAETARQRRAQRTVKELQQTRQRAIRSAAPVITSRNKKLLVVTKAKRGTNLHRFNIAIGLPEVRLHKPGFAISQLRGDWRRTSALIAILLGMIIYFALTLPYLHVTTATVLGNNRLSAEEINAVLGVSGQSIFMIQPDEVATRLFMNYHELASVKVSVYLPNQVYVTVSERQPVILWQQDGGYTWIDSTGVAFRPHGLAAGLILVNGLDMPPVNIVPTDDPLRPTPYLQKELVDAILVLAPSAPADSAMIFDPSYGLGWMDNRGWKAFFGTGMQDMPLKARVYQSLVNSLLERGKIPAFISVAYPDAPFYRMTEAKVP